MTKYELKIDGKTIGELSFPSHRIGSKEQTIISLFVMDKLPCDSFVYTATPILLKSGNYGFMATIVSEGFYKTVLGELKVIENK